MTLGKLIDIVDTAYGSGLVRSYFDSPGEDFGDNLAKFIALEIKDTYDPNATTAEQIQGAMRCMRSSRIQLEDVIKALAEHL